jgi:hypothetical protein
VGGGGGGGLEGMSFGKFLPPPGRLHCHISEIFVVIIYEVELILLSVADFQFYKYFALYA